MTVAHAEVIAHAAAAAAVVAAGMQGPVVSG